MHNRRMYDEKYKRWMRGLLGLLVLCTVTVGAWATDVEWPTLQASVTNPDLVLAASQAEELEASLAGHRQATGVDIALVMVESTQGLHLGEFVQRVGDSWSGGSADRNDWVLIVCSVEDLRCHLDAAEDLEFWLTEDRVERMLRRARFQMQDERFDDAALDLASSVMHRTESLTPQTSLRRPLGTYSASLLVLFYLALLLGFLWGRWLESKKPTWPNLAILPVLRSGEFRRAARGVTLMLWVLSPLVVAVVFYRGQWFWLTMPICWMISLIFGTVMARQSSHAFEGYFLLAMTLLACVMMPPNGAVYDGLGALGGMLFLGLFGLSLPAVYMLMFWVIGHMEAIFGPLGGPPDDAGGDERQPDDATEHKEPPSGEDRKSKGKVDEEEESSPIW